MNKHYAQVLGVTLVKKYRVSLGEIVNTYEKLETPIIWEGDLDSPFLKSNEALYLVNLNKEVKIAKVVRSTEGIYLYYTKHPIGEIVENEETEKSRLEAEEKLKSINKKESKVKSESQYLNIDTEIVLDNHLIQLQLLNTYKKVCHPKDLLHLLNSVNNLNNLSKWNKKYQTILDEKLKEIQKFVVVNIGKAMNHSDFHEISGWTEVLVSLESSIVN